MRGGTLLQPLVFDSLVSAGIEDLLQAGVDDVQYLLELPFFTATP